MEVVLAGAAEVASCIYAEVAGAGVFDAGAVTE